MYLKQKIGWKKNIWKKISIFGFSFGDHAVLISSLLKNITSTFCFYGADITDTRRGANFPPIDLLKGVSGNLNFICGSEDDLILLKYWLEIKKG